MSVDGFIAGPEHEMDWIIGYDEQLRLSRDHGGDRRDARRSA